MEVSRDRRTLFAMLALALGACTTSQTMANEVSRAVDKVTGTVAYRERIALDPDAVIKVQLVDVSRADAPATVLGEQVFEAGGKQVPIAFAIAYDPATIEASHAYAVQARIEEGGRLRFINDRRYPVITRGAPREVHLVLKAVGDR